MTLYRVVCRIAEVIDRAIVSNLSLSLGWNLGLSLALGLGLSFGFGSMPPCWKPSISNAEHTRDQLWAFWLLHFFSQITDSLVNCLAEILIQISVLLPKMVKQVRSISELSTSPCRYSFGL